MYFVKIISQHFDGEPGADPIIAWTAWHDLSLQDPEAVLARALKALAAEDCNPHALSYFDTTANNKIEVFRPSTVDGTVLHLFLNDDVVILWNALGRVAVVTIRLFVDVNKLTFIPKYTIATEVRVCYSRPIEVVNRPLLTVQPMQSHAARYPVCLA